MVNTEFWYSEVGSRADGNPFDRVFCGHAFAFFLHKPPSQLLFLPIVSKHFIIFQLIHGPMRCIVLVTKLVLYVTIVTGERLLSNLSKFAVIVWLFIVLILTSSYTTLTLMFTVQHIQMNSNGNYIGCQLGSFTKGFINSPNFKNTNLQPFISPEDSKVGRVSSIIDEIPYIKIFLAKYSTNYSIIRPSVATTHGFAFAFQKGSPLVPEMSRAIAKLRQDGKLVK